MSTFFITRYDDAKRDGGRDGLGLLPIWSRLARQCIWNVTSISSDLAGWRSLLACVAIAEKVAGDPSDQARYRQVLYAAERLIALARAHAPTLQSREGLRGSTSVVALAGPVRVAGTAHYPLLDAQASTGIVGQIGRPAIRSGLLTEDLTLTDDAREHIALDENTLHNVNLRKFLIDGAEIDLSAPPPLLDALARACGPRPGSADERKWLRNKVLWSSDGIDPKGAWRAAKQRCLAESIESLEGLRSDDQPWRHPGRLEQRLKGPEAGDVGAWLADVRALEALLGPMEQLFAFLRGACRAPIKRSELVGEIEKQWDQKHWVDAPIGSAQLGQALTVLDELKVDDTPQPFHDFAKALQEGNPGDCLDALLTRNRQVTARRGSRPWFHCGPDTVQAELPATATPLGALDHWSHSYYIKELRDLSLACAPMPSPGATA